MKENNLIRKFTMYSIIAFIATGVIFSMIISQHLKSDKIENTIEVSRITAEGYLAGRYNREDFENGFKETGILELDKKMMEIQSISDIAQIKLWDKNCKIIYSTNIKDIGKVFSDNEELKEALDEKRPVYDITKAQKQESSGVKGLYKSYIEIYAPVVENQKLVGVIEIYRPFDPIQKDINELNRNIVLSIIGGLAIFFFLLMKLVGNAAKTITEQNLELKGSNDKLNALFLSTVGALSNAIDARDSYTAGHSERVTKISVEMAKTMNLGNEEIKKIELAAIFHDIGKLGLPDNLLMKPGRLSSEEYELVKEHASKGVEIIKDIGLLEDMLPLVLYHHERVDGKGYPYGLSGKEIPLGARIIAIADSYDAMTSDRPYRKGMSHEKALEEVQRCSGGQFDEELVQVFLRIIKK